MRDSDRGLKVKSKFPTIQFETKEAIYTVEVKGEFHQAACRHEFEKGKIVKTSKYNIKGSKKEKDTRLCIKCGKRKGLGNGKRIQRKKIP